MKGVCVGYVNMSCIGAHLRVVPQLVLDEAQQVLLVHAGGVVHVRVHLWEGEGRGGVRDEPRQRSRFVAAGSRWPG